MQETKVRPGYVLVEVPRELVRAVRLFSGSGIQFFISRGRIIMEPIYDKRRGDRVCYLDCRYCPQSYRCEDAYR